MGCAAVIDIAMEGGRRDVCGCPDFVSSGTSAESMAAYIMMNSWKSKI